MKRKPPFLIMYFIGFGLYAVVVGLYLWVTSGETVPAAFRGGPADPATFLSSVKLQQSIVYSVERHWLYFVSYPWEWALYLVLLFTGTASRWQERLERTGWPSAVRLGVFVLGLQAVSFFAMLPLSVIGYSLARRYGVSTQTPLSWIRDKAVSQGIAFISLLLISAAVLWFVGRGGRWWLRLWLLSVPFTLFMMVIQPVVIDPLYNQFNRLSDPALEARILALAAKAEIPADRVYEVNMSEKTNALNAYVTGIGPSLRIVLWDTMLQRLDEKGILLIMAHEMGHYAMHHLEWSALGAVGSSLVMLWLGSRLYVWLLRRYGPGWGIRRPDTPAALPVLLLLLSVLSFVSAPFASAVSRQAELAADQYAFRLIGSAEGAVAMYQALGESSLSEMNPPPLVKLFRSTHPSLLERIVNAQTYDSSSP